MSGQSFGNDELAQFKRTFFEECTELLADLDERLALMQEEVADSEALNAIFRAVHSIKAGAGAFGFMQLVEFAHRYEALLDHLRDGAISQTKHVVDVLIRAGDILAAMVEAAQGEVALDASYGADVRADLDQILSEIESGGNAETNAHQEAAPDQSGGSGSRQTFSIEFRPHSVLFRHGNDPLLLIRELKRLGDAVVTCDYSRLPNLTSLEPEDSYLSWSILLATDHGEAEIREVFEFVEDDCDLKITVVAQAEAVDADVETTPVQEQSGQEAEVLQKPETLAPVEPAAIPQQSSSAPKAPAEAGSKQASAQGGMSSIRVDLERVDRLVNVVGELVIMQSMQAQQASDGRPGTTGMSLQGHEEMARVIRELQECVMAIRMQPVKSVFARMPRLVREVSGKLGKQVRLITEGEQTEVDKTVIEELADPLTHMIRNAIDHGIEDPDVRTENGKKPLGTIKLSARHAGGNIIIQVTDNGQGINRETLLKKAVEKGIVPSDAKLSDEEIDDLIFAPGFSTAQSVTDVSGRGVGMDVVRRNINNLGGRISVQSSYGKGTRFTLTIPLTLAVLDGMLVALGAETYILPLTSIVESFRPTTEQFRALAGGGEVVAMRGEYIRLIRIHQLFNVPDAISDPCKGLVVVTETANGGKVALLIDELIGQQQVVIKSIQENFDPVPGVSGATILGNGRVALILDIEQLKMLQVPAHRELVAARTKLSEDLGASPSSPAVPMTKADGSQSPATV
ncbi:chemotaxis protein CheA [Roseibium sp.]|uniref:chemotaxis protein CheA n=1 Tax=Roseibium sp. TaxID=1936156 RepID=UPI003B52E4C3